MKYVVAALSLLLLVLPSTAQTSITTELSYTGYASGGFQSAADMTILISPGVNRMSSYNTVEMHPISATNPEISSFAGVQYVVASSKKLELSAITQGGAAYAGNIGTAAAFNGGGKVALWPGWESMPGLYFHVMATARGTSDALGGWYPAITIGCGYQFQGIGLTGTLKSRRALAASKRSGR